MDSLLIYVWGVVFFILFIYCTSNIILPLCFALPRLLKLERDGIIQEFPILKVVFAPVLWSAITAFVVILTQMFIPQFLEIALWALGIATIVTFWQVIKGSKTLENDFTSSYLAYLKPASFNYLHCAKCEKETSKTGNYTNMCLLGISSPEEFAQKNGMMCASHAEETTALIMQEKKLDKKDFDKAFEEAKAQIATDIDKQLSRLPPLAQLVPQDTEYQSYGSKDFGIILFSIYKNEYSKADLLDPDNSILGGTPFYTYLNLLDKWFVMDKNPNVKAHFPNLDLNTSKGKLNALLILRGYGEKDIKKLLKKKSQTHRSAILTIIDFEFGNGNPNDPDGSIWSGQRESFIENEIPKIETAYEKYREISNLG